MYLIIFPISASQVEPRANDLRRTGCCVNAFYVTSPNQSSRDENVDKAELVINRTTS